MEAIVPFGPLTGLTPFYGRPDSPRHSPAWRWLRAHSLLATKGRASPRHDDAEVRRARSYLQWLASKDVTRDRKKSGRYDLEIATAIELARDVDPRKRWKVEAYLLTDLPLEEVAHRCDISPSTLLAYHSLFFCVRDQPVAQDWLMNQAVGCGPWNNFAGPPLEVLRRHRRCTSARSSDRNLDE